MIIKGKRRLVVSLLVAGGVLASPSAVSAACDDVAADGVDWTSCYESGTEHADAVLTNATLTGANLSASTLTGANLSGATVGLVGETATNFANADAVGINMSNLDTVVPADAEDADRLVIFSGGDFTGGDFTGADLQNAYMFDANLTDADFTGATILSAVFVGADLEGATFDQDEVADQAGTNFLYAPEGTADTATAGYETAKTIDVLVNDENFNGTDDGRTFMPTALTDPENGTVEVNQDGTVTYTPADGFSGSDTFTYIAQSTLPDGWDLPVGVGLTSDAAEATTVTVTVEAEGVDPEAYILSGRFVGMSGIDGRIARLYAAFFFRNPDDPGFEFWETKIKAGAWTNVSAANFFSGSDEFITLYGGNLSNGEYVTLIYNNALNRDPEQKGFDYWVGQLDDGKKNRGAVMLSVSDSTEFKGLTKTS